MTLYRGDRVYGVGVDLELELELGLGSGFLERFVFLQRAADPLHSLSFSGPCAGKAGCALMRR